MKLNLGAGPYWYKEGWYVLDHKLKKNSQNRICGDISKINLDSNSCDVVFISHVIEHIPHLKIQKILAEINRVLKKDGVLRILVPDMEKFAKAYVKKDKKFFIKAKEEDTSLRQDLGFGGMLANLFVSPGQDTVLFDRNIQEFISGYAHLYAYDFLMMKKILERSGFYKIVRKEFCKSSVSDFSEPLHVIGLGNKYFNLNEKFYKKNNLLHKYQNGTYKVNFKITGFDKFPHISLILEAKKKNNFKLKKSNNMNYSKYNYNRYGYSLMEDKLFSNKANLLLKVSKKFSQEEFRKKLIKIL
jgi:SAM-dependent methyltransferase